jgi:hypothetical protein
MIIAAIFGYHPATGKYTDAFHLADWAAQVVELTPLHAAAAAAGCVKLGNGANYRLPQALNGRTIKVTV